MAGNIRREARSASGKTYSLSWQDSAGCTRSEQVEGSDVSPHGLAVKCSVALASGKAVHIEEVYGPLSVGCFVRHCEPIGNAFLIGLEQEMVAKKSSGDAAPICRDYYSFLQISPHAENETIHRVYRFLAGRFHPDNPDTGDPEKFLLLKRAFETLTDPELRAQYDASLSAAAAQPLTAMQSVDFLDGIEGEVNRRLAVLSILYERRRVNSEHPHVSLVEMEARMGIPRDYLDFTTWYEGQEVYYA